MNYESEKVTSDINKTVETIDLSFLGVNKNPNLEHSDNVLHCIAALWSQSVLFALLERADFGRLASDCLYHQMLDSLQRCLWNHFVFYFMKMMIDLSYDKSKSVKVKMRLTVTVSLESEPSQNLIEDLMASDCRTQYMVEWAISSLYQKLPGLQRHNILYTALESSQSLHRQ